MRFLVQVTFPHEPFNSAVRAGTAGQTIQRILAEQKPEAVYFTDIDGQRGGIMVLDIADASRLPAVAEPWFLSFEADIKVNMVMTPEDLGRSGLDAIGKSWPLAAGSTD